MLSDFYISSLGGFSFVQYLLKYFFLQNAFSLQSKIFWQKYFYIFEWRIFLVLTQRNFYYTILEKNNSLASKNAYVQAFYVHLQCKDTYIFLNILTS